MERGHLSYLDVKADFLLALHTEGNTISLRVPAGSGVPPDAVYDEVEILDDDDYNPTIRVWFRTDDTKWGEHHGIKLVHELTD